MAKGVYILLLFSSLAAVQATETEMEMETTGNPMRKVIRMLQHMQKLCKEQGEKVQQLFDKNNCHCITAGKELAASVADATEKIPELKSTIESAVSSKTQLDKDLVDHKADRAAGETSMSEATALRKKEKASFIKESADSKSQMKTIKRALPGLMKGGAAAFLQTDSATVLHKFIADKEDMDASDRQRILSFLSGEQSESNQGPDVVVGILKQMNDDIIKSLAEAKALEKGNVVTYEALMKSKDKQVKVATRMIEDKLQRTGQVAIEVATFQDQLESTQQQLAEDEKMKASLQTSCATKAKDFEEGTTERSKEMVALADTIKMLSNEAAETLLRKTTKRTNSNSFLQLQATEHKHKIRSRAQDILRSSHRSLGTDFISLAMHGEKKGFAGVIKMVDEYVSTLKLDQKSETKKKVYCVKKLEEADDKKISLTRDLADGETSVGKANEDISTLNDLLKKMQSGLEELDKSVKETTALRKSENAEFDALMAQDGPAKELLNFAKNRLNKYYNPRMYGSPKEKKTLLLESHPIVENKYAGFVQVASHNNHEHRKGNSNKVIRMLDDLIMDIDREMTTAKTTEKLAQADYVKAMADFATKRANDAKALSNTNAQKADLDAALEALIAVKKAKTAELAATKEMIRALKSDCDWMLQNFDARKSARIQEIESLANAKAVLSGASYSFLQVTSSQSNFLAPASSSSLNL